MQSSVTGIDGLSRRSTGFWTVLQTWEDPRDIEQAIRELWGLTPEQGAYINGEFVHVPPSQAVQGLFPAGIPGVREVWIGG